jgi:hypothetical protein
LDPNVLDRMRCEACEQTFSFAIMECHRCDNERVFTWSHEPAVTALDMLTCDQCGSTFRYHDAEDQQASHS